MRRPLHPGRLLPGHPKIAELCSRHAADVAARSRNANGNTPLHAALAANQKMVAGLLIGTGADVNAADAAGWRPLHLAAANNDLDAMKALIMQGAGSAPPTPTVPLRWHSREEQSSRSSRAARTLTRDIDAGRSRARISVLALVFLGWASAELRADGCSARNSRC